MRVLVAPQELKGSLTAGEAADAIIAGVRGARPTWQLDRLPIADGGPGTVDFVMARLPTSHERWCVVDGPLGRPVKARWLMLEDDETGLIEMAQASGLWRVPEAERAVLEATTRGTGQVMKAALDAGCRRLIIGAGGSATNDAGAGAAAALGVRFFDGEDRPLQPTPKQLARCARVDVSGLHPALERSTVEVWADVRTPLLGPSGATAMFAAQKGASPADLEQLEATLGQLERLVAPGSGSRPGTGAAGGLSWGLSVWCQAAIHPGFLSLAALTGFGDVLAACDRLVTAEGRLDGQSAEGKGPWALAKLAARYEKKTSIFVGNTTIAATQTPFDEVIITGPELPKDTQAASARLAACAHAWADQQRPAD